MPSLLETIQTLIECGETPETMPEMARFTKWEKQTQRFYGPGHHLNVGFKYVLTPDLNAIEKFEMEHPND